MLSVRNEKYPAMDTDSYSKMMSLKRAVERCSEKIANESFPVHMTSINQEEKKLKEYYRQFVAFHSESIEEATGEKTEELEAIWEELL